MSVVVCTLGRVECLEACLAALRGQTLAGLEKIVVMGPCEPQAEEMLSGQPDVRLLRIDRRNLSAARNVGVAAAGGSIVAFCDDDAAPRPDWLEHISAAFENPDVAAAGGQVLDGRTDPPEPAFCNGIVRLSGRQIDVRDRPGEFNDPRGPWYNRVCGCCCAFRKDALQRIGGFDEFIEFAYDETDVCVRLIRAGFRVVHVPQAVVVHMLAPGGHRQDELVRNWHCELKNQLYFAMKNRRRGSGVRAVVRAIGRLIALSVRFARAARRGAISRQQARRFRRDARRGVWAGIRAGLRRHHRPAREAPSRM
ncbi:MAG TPA: glycosyltransferase [Phycisphaerae bacterium]|nr:glycosyltransferase [Phycisphaerae bacterium]